MKQSILFALLAAGLLASCNRDEPQPKPTSDPVAAQVTASINQALPRVSVGDDGAAAFTAGDRINVVATGNATHVYTFDGTAWSAGNNPYYFQDQEDVNFRAWYADPAAAPAGNTIAIDTRTQPVGNNGWNGWDILATPTVTASATAPTVRFTGDDAFAHVMTQVTFVFQAGDGVTDLAALTGYTLKGLVTDATFNTLACTLAAGSTTADVGISGISGALGTEHACTPLILVPQAADALDLEVAYNGQVYTAHLAAPADGLQAGYSYTFTVTISNSRLEAGTATIGAWNTDPGFDGNVDATL